MIRIRGTEHGQTWQREGTRVVLPAGWGLEAGPAGLVESPDFVLCTRDL